MDTKKYAKMVTLAACVVAVVFAGASCKKESDEERGAAEKPEESPAASDEVWQVVPLEGVGPVKFGMSRKEVIKQLGPPDRDEAGARVDYRESRGLYVLLCPGSGVCMIDCWSKAFPTAAAELTTFSGKTDKGIGMGASRKQVIAAYGEPDKESEISSREIGVLVALRYERLKAQFTLREDKLVRIKIRAP